jgi:glutamyl-tRNA synthetase
LVQAFSLERINKAGAKFDVNKAKWFNEQYLKNQPLADLVSAYLPEMEKAKAEAFASLYLDRITFPNQLKQLSAEFFEVPSSYDEQVLTSKWNAENKKALELLVDKLSTSVEDWKNEAIKNGISSILEEAGIKMGKVMQLLRVALSGNGAGPDLMISMELWGRDSVFNRLKIALEKFPPING